MQWNASLFFLINLIGTADFWQSFFVIAFLSSRSVLRSDSAKIVCIREKIHSKVIRILSKI